MTYLDNRTAEEYEAIDNEKLFDQVEELIGTWASASAMRNALYAVMWNDDYNQIAPDPFHPALVTGYAEYMEHRARKYEATRGIHMHVGGNTCDENCNNPAMPLGWGDPSLIARKGNCDPFVNFDHSDCTGDECKFDEGAYL